MINTIPPPTPHNVPEPHALHQRLIAVALMIYDRAARHARFVGREEHVLNVRDGVAHA
jgi:hypothetical protein